MAHITHENDNASGYISSPITEGVSREFTAIEPMAGEGMTRLYKAKRYGRWYVLKTLAPEGGGALAGYGQLLQKEFNILIRMQHPGVVQAIDMEQVKGVGMCIVMEYVDGQTLEQWLQSDPDKKSRRRIVMEVAEALAYVHSLGIVHRDLKPENVMVTRSGQRAKLIDFGMADTDRYAVLKQPAGTLAYMSPEQASTSITDVRNDIYSLGVVMERMMLGNKYNKVVKRCLCPMDRRWSNMSEFLTAMQRLETHRLRPWTIAAVILMLAAALGYQTWQLHVAGNAGGVSKAELDSMRHKMSVQQQRSEQSQAALGQKVTSTMKALDDSIRHLTAVNTQLKEQLGLEERMQQEALKALHNKMRLSGVEKHLDTLSRWDYRWPDLSERIAEMGQYAFAYTEQLEGKCDRTMQTRIREAMQEDWKRWNEKVNNLINSILSVSRNNGSDPSKIINRIPKNKL